LDIFATVGVRDFWENGCSHEIFVSPSSRRSAARRYPALPRSVSGSRRSAARRHPAPPRQGSGSWRSAAGRHPVRPRRDPGSRLAPAPEQRREWRARDAPPSRGSDAGLSRLRATDARSRDRPVARRHAAEPPHLQKFDYVCVVGNAQRRHVGRAPLHRPPVTGGFGLDTEPRPAVAAVERRVSPKK